MFALAIGKWRPDHLHDVCKHIMGDHVAAILHDTNFRITNTNVSVEPTTLNKFHHEFAISVWFWYLCKIILASFMLYPPPISHTYTHTRTHAHTHTHTHTPPPPPPPHARENCSSNIFYTYKLFLNTYTAIWLLWCVIEKYRTCSFQLFVLCCSCKWNGGPCPNSSISTIYTDHGLCHSFNVNIDPRLAVKQTGNSSTIIGACWYIHVYVYACMRVRTSLCVFLV